MGAPTRGAVVHRRRGIEGTSCNQEPLEQDALLELEVLTHDVSDVGGLDGKGYGNVGLFQDVVDLEVADNTALGEPLHLHRELFHLFRQLPLALQHLCEALLNGVGQFFELITLRITETWFESAHDFKLAVDFSLIELRFLLYCVLNRWINEILADISNGANYSSLVGPHPRLVVGKGAGGRGGGEGEQAAGLLGLTLGAALGHRRHGQAGKIEGRGEWGHLSKEPPTNSLSSWVQGAKVVGEGTGGGEVHAFEMEPDTCFDFLTVSALSPFRKQLMA